MKTETIHAIPTRYKGVTYRSRSEARFAAFLDMPNSIYQYEPKKLCVGSYTPDFLFMKKFGEPLNYTQAFVIEYKPKWPNREYRSFVIDNFRSISRTRFSFFTFFDVLNFALVAGNPFEGNRVALDCDWDMSGAWGRESWSFLCTGPKDEEIQLDYSRNYRYDLGE